MVPLGTDRPAIDFTLALSRCLRSSSSQNLRRIMCANSNDSNSWRALRLAHFPDLTLSVAAILLDTKPPGAIAAGWTCLGVTDAAHIVCSRNCNEMCLGRREQSLCVSLGPDRICQSEISAVSIIADVAHTKRRRRCLH